MNKKHISAALAALLIALSMSVPADAVSVENESSGVKGTFFFDCGDWNSSDICFYIWDATSGEYAEADGWNCSAHWASKKRLGGKPVYGKEGVFESYPIDFSGREDHDICVIFHDTNTNAQTFDCRINASVFGRTAKRSGNRIEDYRDFEKEIGEVEFDGGSNVGSALRITTTGHIVGSVLGNADGTYEVANYIYRHYGSPNPLTGEEVVTKSLLSEAVDKFQTDKYAVWSKYKSFDSRDDGAYQPDDVRKLLDIKKGDLDDDGNITSADSLMILRRSVWLEEFSEVQEELAEIDGDGKISSADALEVLRYSVKLPAHYDIG